METSEMRTLSPDELKGRVKNWRDELFRTRFKAQGSEARDTSVVKKLRREIARALTILNEKQQGLVVNVKPKPEKTAKPAKVAKPKAEKIEEPEAAEASAEAKPAKKKAAKKKE